MTFGASLEGARYDPLARHGHVESYFLKINDATATRALWIKATILSRGVQDAVAESWAIAFERGKPAGFVAVKNVLPIALARFDRDALSVELRDLSLTRTHARGDITSSSDPHIAFDLELADATEPLVHFPSARMYSGPFPSSKLVSPMPDLRARGEVRVGEETWRVDGWRGLLGHNWGRGHAFSYAWGHCNIWNESDDVVFEGTSARVRIGPILAPTTTLLLVRHRGETHALNHVRELATNHGSMTFRRWRFSGDGPTMSISGEMSAETDEMVGLHYENPNGAMTYCLNSKLASARVELRIRGAAPLVVTSRSAALEIGTRDPDHGVTMAL